MRTLPPVLLATDSFESQVEITGQPPKDLVMVVIPLGDQPGGILGRGRELTSDRVDLVEANSECDWIAPPGTSMNQAYIPREEIRNAYGELYRDELPEDLNGLRPSVTERILIRPLRSLTSRALFGPDLADTDQKSLAQGIAELSAKIVACRLRTAAGRDSIRSARRRYLYSRTCEYIDSNLESSISISDICRDLNVSISTLERVFRQTTGMPPLAYVQSRRMNRARHLLLASGNALTVAEVALQCGLTHFGRFSQCYKSFFGELPSQTGR